MKQYLDLLRDVKANGEYRSDRTGTGTYSVFCRQLRFNLEEGFPLVTTKKAHMKSVIHELLWFIKGDTNVGYLQENGVSIWNEWADVHGDLGPVYGKQWRDFGGVDQLKRLVDGLKRDPNGRRHIVSAWNPPEIDDMALPPCHMMFQCYVANGKLSLHVYQRSADLFLGVPFNIASYALLTMMLAQVCDLAVGELVWTGGDCHVYSTHLEQVDAQIERQPYALPIVYINPWVNDLFKFSYNDFSLVGYECHPHIPAPVAI